MKAVLLEQYGEPEVLHYADAPRPVAGPSDAVVNVKAVGVSGVDLLIRSGRYRPNPGFPHILGGDFAGEVAEIGDEVSPPVAVGQRVIGHGTIPCLRCEQCVAGNSNRCALDFKYLGAHLPGGYAEYVRLPARNLIEIPANMEWEEAAAFRSAFGTAWHMLITRGHLQAGETVLIQAASSGVSTAAIQIAKLAGATVFASTSEDWKVERAKTIGADVALNRHSVDIREEVLRLTGKRGVDAVVDHVGGELFESSIKCLTRGGRLLTCGATASYKAQVNLEYIFHKELSVLGSNSFLKRELELMMALVRDGSLKPVVDKVFPLESAAEAHVHQASNERFGKVVLRVAQ